MQEIPYPNGSRVIVIKPGRGMLRRCRRLANAYRCIVEAVSRRGNTIAYCSPGRTAFMTWGGYGRPIPHVKSVQYQTSKRSGARRSSCWK